MSQFNHDEALIEQIERLLEARKRQRKLEAGNPRHHIRPIRTWDEQTRHLRFAQKVKLHRYPGGLANTTRWRRDQMLAAYRSQTESLTGQARADVQARHEALAYALDAERFLGSLDQRDERDYFPIEGIDALAEHLLCWLEERGYRMVRVEEG